MEKFAIVFLGLLLLAPPAFPQTAAQLLDRKDKLEAINKQLSEKQAELERYQAEQKQISSEIDKLRRQDRLTKGRQRELEGQLGDSRRKGSETREKLASLERAQDELAGAASSEVAMYATDRLFYSPYYGRADLMRDVFIRTAIMNKYALAATLKGEKKRISDDIQTLAKRQRELSVNRERLAREITVSQRNVRTKQQELSLSKSREKALRRELEDLKNAAAGLSTLVKKLEKQAPYKTRKAGDLPIERNSLPWPAAGRLISKYGREHVPELKTWIVREGIRIRTADRAPVTPVLPGKVIYSGPFRTYGNVVIVDHEKGFFTVYGLLSSVTASKGDSVGVASRIGFAGADTQAISGGETAEGSTVYFEIRSGADAINPLPWLTPAP
ncbi:MAG: membrane-bound metallopeptidase [Elusimicrobia bacterium]|nr:MAG: membrane-bound metallopeptidase [Elusimicrobiota bacterium]KAF0157844.1 MAG: membrane-bound metallopeptidase [Elusimicrobiota bacterium]